MPAYKLKGKIAQSGQLILTEPINLTPGEVEVIILQPNPVGEDSSVWATASNHEIPKKIVKERVKSLKELLETAPPIPPDFDPEQARWEALKEKYDL
jgi:hypothetical protein